MHLTVRAQRLPRKLKLNEAVIEARVAQRAERVARYNGAKVRENLGHVQAARAWRQIREAAREAGSETRRLVM